MEIRKRHIHTVLEGTTPCSKAAMRRKTFFFFFLWAPPPLHPFLFFFFFFFLSFFFFFFFFVFFFFFCRQNNFKISKLQIKFANQSGTHTVPKHATFHPPMHSYHVFHRRVERPSIAGVTVYLAPLDSLPPGGQAVPGYLAPHPGYLHPRGVRYPSWFILPPGGEDNPAGISCPPP